MSTQKRKFILAAWLIAVLIPSAFAQLRTGETLIARGGDWNYLLYTDVANQPANPADADADFYTTWNAAAGYDGPLFTTAPGPLGYGALEQAAPATNVWAERDGETEPPSGSRYTVYFTQVVTPSEDAVGLRFTGFIDDGAVIYVNGTEIVRTPSMPTVDDVANPVWDTLSDALGSETVALAINVAGLNLPSGAPVTVGISLHNRNNDSSDLWMDLGVTALTADPPSAPDNDNAANAEVIVVDNGLPVTVTGRTHNGSFPLDPGATVEGGEPSHAGIAPFGSVWYSYQPTVSGFVEVSAAGSNFDEVLAVYTPPTVPVASATSDTLFYAGATVRFQAVAGQTYLIAVSGEDNGGAPVFGENYGNVSLTIREAQPLFTEISTLLPAGSSWNYLIATQDDLVDPTLTNQPIDPATSDPDFHTTWQTAAGYDGPAFQGPAPALLGYGEIVATGGIVTDIWGARDTDGDANTENLVPPTGLRYAAYFRTTFTPTSAVQHLGFRGLIDDGAAIFINGVEVSRINFFGNAANWQTTAAGTGGAGIGTEQGPQEGVAANVGLPANVPVEIAVTLRNNAPTSSDMGFDLEVYSIQPPVIDLGKPLASNDPLIASFDTAAEGALSGAGDGGDFDNLGWSVVSGAAMSEVGLPNEPTENAGNALYANNAIINFTSDPIDVSGVDNSEVVATIDVRMFEDSGASDFEAVDVVQAWIEGSTDGVTFTRIATVMAATSGGTPDDLKALELADGAYTIFRSVAGSIPATVTSIRVRATAVINSGSEHAFFDNVSVGTDLGPPPAFIANIERNQVTGQNTITWNTDADSVYTLFYSPTDLSGWTVLTSGQTNSFSHTTGADTEGFYYVSRQAD